MAKKNDHEVSALGCLIACCAAVLPGVLFYIGIVYNIKWLAMTIGWGVIIFLGLLLIVLLSQKSEVFKAIFYCLGILIIFDWIFGRKE